MSKRRPDYELTHDNWNDDIPTEEAGIFTIAATEELDKRVIKKAKRKLPESSGNAVGQGIFANFTAFGKTGSSPSSSNGKPFDFLKSLTNATGTKKAENDKANVPGSNAVKVDSIFGNVGVRAEVDHQVSKVNNGGKTRGEYLQNLRKLNEDFVNWIKGHFDKNPYLDLTPVFNDYSEHLKELEDKYSEFSIAKKPTPLTSPPPSNSGLGVFSSGAEIKRTETVSLVNSSTIIPPLTTAPTTILQNESSSEQQKEDENNDEEESCKNEVKVFEEENTKFQTRCKLFYKKDASFVEKGVGTLYVKSSETTKSSLLIRAETSLGNILLNILLTSSIPVQLTGKNNVTLICVPNPPLTSKSEEEKVPVTFLIRVKDTDVANELLKHIQDAKK